MEVLALVAVVLGVVWLRRCVEPTVTIHEVEVSDRRDRRSDLPHVELPFAAKHEAELRARDELRAYVQEERPDDLDDEARATSPALSWLPGPWWDALPSVRGGWTVRPAICLRAPMRWSAALLTRNRRTLWWQCPAPSVTAWQQN